MSDDGEIKDVPISEEQDSTHNDENTNENNEEENNEQHNNNEEENNNDEEQEENDDENNEQQLNEEKDEEDKDKEEEEEEEEQNAEINNEGDDQEMEEGENDENNDEEKENEEEDDEENDEEEEEEENGEEEDDDDDEEGKLSPSEFSWRDPISLLQDLEESRPNEFCIVRDNETTIEALERMDESLLSSRPGNSILPPFLTTTVPKGRIGLGSIDESEPIFFRPGTYWWLGVGIEWNEEPIFSLTEPKIVNRTVSIITLTDTDGAVIQDGSTLLTLGKGQYIIREPVELLGVFNESNFGNVVKERTTAGGRTEATLLGRTIEGDCTFLQVSAGCCAVVQAGDDLVVFKEGFYRLKSLDHAIDRWLDLREVSDTVLNIQLTTSNQAQISISINIRCRLRKPILFTQTCEYSDLQDALNAKSIDVLQNLIGSITYESIIQPVEEGKQSFDEWLSNRATNTLRPYAKQLGGKLIEISVVNRYFDESRQSQLDRQAQDTIQVEAQRINSEKMSEIQKKEAESDAQRDRIQAEGSAEATRIGARANRDQIEQEALAKARAAREIAQAYSNIKDEFARSTLRSQGQLSKFQAVGDKPMLIPADLSLNVN